ncbi:MAG: hypothetical protein A2091_04505 [Desulfuromonadales bacterium GWD2_61_12]|nr:MAG: hypothetical protein A2005_07570 [Desulfuromonadales bacterium GWC2_61_20]OGR34467.1 MAG: hypothetical protein A2091_04505 [Desulfuromonadales bacterium GWD2_61_12]
MSISTINATTPHLLGPWRRRCQWLITLIVLALPWFTVGGQSPLRLDFATLSLHLFGQTLRIEELYLILFFSLTLALVFLLGTLALGRVWCGWLCPQTTLNDLAEWLGRCLSVQIDGRRVTGAAWRQFLRQCAYLLLSLLVAMNLLWYFIEPQRFLKALASGTLAPVAFLALAICTLVIYFDLALIRRLMCKEFCPYGRIQTALADNATLTLHRPAAEAPRCIECGACVRCCPMDIDIRLGYQIECINCGRCLDACRQVMAQRREPGLIRYTFGTEDLGWRALLNPKILLLTAALLTLMTIFVVAVVRRQEATVKVALSHTAPSRLLPDGRRVTFFSVWVNNRLAVEKEFELAAIHVATGSAINLRGVPSPIRIAGGKNLPLEVALVTASGATADAIEFVLTTDGRKLATANAEIAKELPQAHGH